MFESLMVKSESELIAEDGDLATWYVRELDDGRWLAWESVTGWCEMTETREDALAMIDYEAQCR